MKINILTTLLTVCSAFLVAQTTAPFNPAVQWEKKSFNQITSTAIGRENVITSELDPSTGDIYSLIEKDSPEADFYFNYKLNKYDNNANLIYSLELFNGIKDNAINITDFKIDPTGYLYMTGNYVSSETGNDDGINFDFINTTSPYNLTAEQGTFLAKYELSNLSLVWAKSLDMYTTSPCALFNAKVGAASKLALDATGNIHVLCHATYFLNQTDPFAGEWSRPWIYKVGTNGSTIWKKTIDKYSPSALSEAQDITVDAQNNVFIVGMYEQQLTFSSTVFLGNTLNTLKYFMAKYSSTGSLAWAKNITTNPTKLSRPTKLKCTIEQGRLHVFGDFIKKINVTSSNIVLTGAQTKSDIFWIRYNASTGSVISATKLGNAYTATDDDKLNSILTDAKGNIYVNSSVNDVRLRIARYKRASASSISYSATGSKYLTMYATNPNISPDDANFDNLADYSLSKSLIIYDKGQMFDLFLTGHFAKTFVTDWNNSSSTAHKLTVSGSDENSYVIKYTGSYVSSNGQKDANEETDNEVLVDSENELESNITSIEEAVNTIAVNVYPNPCVSYVVVDLNNSLTSEARISIMDVTGKVVKTETVTGEKHQINVEELPSGYYILAIESTEATFTQKIIKQ